MSVRTRPIWTGHLRLSLVSIAVEVFPAIESGSHIIFKKIHEPSGRRIRYEKVAPGIGPIPKEKILKGYEVSKDKYILIDPEKIEAIRLESKKTLELVQFVDTCDIPPFYYDKPYYFVPADDNANDAYQVIRDPMRKIPKVGLG